jgi:hypothetical protein
MVIRLLAFQVNQEAIKSVPEIIKAAAQSYLGILALMVLVIGVIAYLFFKESPHQIRVAIVVLMLGGVAAFGVAAMRLQKSEAENTLNSKKTQMDAQSQEALRYIKNLRLKLRFPDSDPADPWRATVDAFVRKPNEAVGKLANDLIGDPIRTSSGVNVDFSKLEVGDVVYIVVKDGDKVWRSDDMTVLEAHLVMNPRQVALAKKVK